MKYKKIYDKWVQSSFLDEDIKKELSEISHDEDEIRDRFYKELEFGTAGMRGKLGAGTNRMNKYIVSRATQGFCDYILEQGKSYGSKGIVIAHDNRLFSKEFAKISALVLAGNGIKAYLFESLRPTPELSFAIRKLKCIGGINITASHNPKDYNGYKVYWREGSQILDHRAKGITAKIENIKNFENVRTMEEYKAVESGLLQYIGKTMDDSYLSMVKKLSLRDVPKKNINVVYTPLNGAGNESVRRILFELGFTNLHVVEEQAEPDPYFTTVPYPNPENPKSFEYAIKLGDRIKADVILATDPDCDRLAVAARDSEGNYHYFSGNALGALLVDYILGSMKKNEVLSKKNVIVKSIVSGNLPVAIAKSFGIETIETLTGFKHICEWANRYDKTGEKKFLFGFEESMGYVLGTSVRDKDGVIASMLTVEMAAYYKTRGITLVDRLQYLYGKFGFFKEKQIAVTLEGTDGNDKLDKLMKKIETEYILNFGFAELIEFFDLKQGTVKLLKENRIEKLNLPKSMGLKFIYSDESWFAVRPSGTEPKIKIYINSKAKTEEESLRKLHTMEKKLKEIFKF